MDRQNKIFEIIKNIVCVSCGRDDTDICQKYKKRCFSLYKREAEKIYNEVVKPLEDKNNYERL